MNAIERARLNWKVASAARDTLYAAYRANPYDLRGAIRTMQFDAVCRANDIVVQKMEASANAIRSHFGRSVR